MLSYVPDLNQNETVRIPILFGLSLFYLIECNIIFISTLMQCEDV